MKNITLLSLLLLFTGSALAQNKDYLDPPMDDPVASPEWLATAGATTSGVKLLDSVIAYQENEDGRYLSHRRFYNYDDQGRITLRNSRTFHPTDSTFRETGWLSKYTYTEDLNTYVKYLWEDGDWRIFERHRESLDAEGRVRARLIESWSISSNQLRLDGLRYFTYAPSDDQLEKEILYRWRDDVWNLTHQIEYTYNAQGLREKIESYSWDKFRNEWRLFGRREWTYDASDKVISDLDYFWTAVGVLALNDETYYYYNGDHLIDSIVAYEGYLVDNGNGTVGDKRIYSHQSERAITDTLLFWEVQNPVFAPSYYWDRRYDTDGDIEQIMSYRYQDSIGVYQWYQVNDYYYSQLGVGTKTPAAVPDFQCQTANPHTPGQPIHCPSGAQQPTAIQVYDLQGRLHWQKRLDPSAASTITLEGDWPAGLYILTWWGSDGLLGRQKLLIL